jgi:hypothetical protein
VHPAPPPNAIRSLWLLKDALTNTVSSVNIETTSWTAFGGTTYTIVNPGFTPTPGEIAFVSNPLCLILQEPRYWTCNLLLN